MNEPGHVYILVNPSMEGLVKIGKTTREPEARAKELSQATGVATPFYVAFSICVLDCHAAEEFVHAILDHNGFRHTKNREFFQIPLRQAIEVLLLAEKELGSTAAEKEQNIESESTPDENYPNETENQEHPGRAVYDQAMNVFMGLGNEIEDKDEGVRLLERAKSLNFPAAYTSLAIHYINEANDEAFGSGTNYAAALEMWNTALSILKEGAKQGHGRCWVLMAEIYSEGLTLAEIEPSPVNANKCWKNYFQSETFRSDDDEKWTQDCWGVFDLNGLTSLALDTGCSRSDYIERYLWVVEGGAIPADPEILEIIKPFTAK